MNNNGQDLEHRSAQYLQDFMGRVLQLLSEHFKGETTINHLRVGNYIGLKTLFKLEATNNKDISETLKIPASTVSRIVADLIEHKYVTEKQHEDDGRIRLISIIDGHPLAQGFETDLRILVSELLQHYDEKQFVPGARTTSEIPSPENE